MQVICSVVGHYVDKVCEYLPDCVGDQKQAWHTLLIILIVLRMCIHVAVNAVIV